MVPEAGLEPACFKGGWFWVNCVCHFATLACCHLLVLQQCLHYLYILFFQVDFWIFLHFFSESTAFFMESDMNKKLPSCGMVDFIIMLKLRHDFFRSGSVPGKRITSFEIPKNSFYLKIQFPTVSLLICIVNNTVNRNFYEPDLTKPSKAKSWIKLFSRLLPS